MGCGDVIMVVATTPCCRYEVLYNINGGCFRVIFVLPSAETV